MQSTLLALVLAVASASALAHEGHDHEDEHGALGAHVHGVANLDLAVDGDSLQLALHSPTMNLVGFEHAASSDADKATVAAARAQLEKPLELFELPAAAGCKVAQVELHSVLFGNAEEHEHEHEEHEHGDEHAHHAHADLDGDYRFTCADPDALDGIDLASFFSHFPATHKIVVQAIGPNGQQGAELSPADTRLAF